MSAPYRIIKRNRNKRHNKAHNISLVPTKTHSAKIFSPNYVHNNTCLILTEVTQETLTKDLTRLSRQLFSKRQELECHDLHLQSRPQ